MPHSYKFAITISFVCNFSKIIYLPGCREQCSLIREQWERIGEGISINIMKAYKWYDTEDIKNPYKVYTWEM